MMSSSVSLTQSAIVQSFVSSLAGDSSILIDVFFSGRWRFSFSRNWYCSATIRDHIADGEMSSGRRLVLTISAWFLSAE